MPTEAAGSAVIDPVLVQWLVVQALHDRDARLVDGGSLADDRIALARLFIDLPVALSPHARRPPPHQGLALDLLLDVHAAKPHELQVLLVGGPGSGKSTLTTMLAQMLRLPLLERNRQHIPPLLRDAWEKACTDLLSLHETNAWPTVGHALPLRVDLPHMARWMASQRDGHAEPMLWQYLAARAHRELAARQLSAALTPTRLRQLAEAAGPIVWILDGLDEVPPSAGRAEVIEAVRAVVCEASAARSGLVVATRPQGYADEFDTLDTMTLRPLTHEQARIYGERLVKAWALRADASDLDDRLERLHEAFDKPEVEALLLTPLHTTIAAVLVASRGKLPRARHALFGNYFEIVLQRELSKRVDQQIADDDRPVLRALHAQAGLLLHVRAQTQQGARASLRRRELATLLRSLYEAQGFQGDELRARVERLLRFAAERLVLLIHDAEGEYAFGVRSLQEYFAAEALRDGEELHVAARLDAVLPVSHWSNVVAFVVSHYAAAATPHERAVATRLTVDRCAGFNRGVHGPAAARCLLGSHLALAMLQEVRSYAMPWLCQPLWDLAFEAAITPSQDWSAWMNERHPHSPTLAAWADTVEIHLRLGLLAASQSGDIGNIWRERIRETAAHLFARGGEDRTLAWRLLHGLLLEHDAKAEALATANAPSTEVESRTGLRLCQHAQREVLPAWWCRFIDAHPEWFTPAHVPRNGFVTVPQRTAPALHIATALRMGFPSSDIVSAASIGACSWVPLASPRSLPTEMPTVSPRWQVWHHVAAFFNRPSPDTLADVVDALADPEALAELRPFVYAVPWPLATCVLCVDEGADAHTLAIELRAGKLGQRTDWQATEQHFEHIPADALEHWQVLWTERRPWPSTPGEGRLPIPQCWLYIDPLALTRWLEAEPRGAPMALRNMTRAALAQIQSADALAVVDKLVLGQPPHGNSRERILVHLPLNPSEWDRWLPVLEARGRLGLNTRTSFFSDSAALLRWLFDQFRSDPSRWGLLDAMEASAHWLPTIPPAARTLPALPDGVPPRAHARHCLLTLCDDASDEAAWPTRLANLVGSDQAGPYDLREALARHLGEARHDASRATRLLLAALDAPPNPAATVRDALLGALYRLAAARPPAFDSPEAWARHHLPPPCLAAQPAPRLPPVLRSITALRNLRCFADTPAVDAPFPRPEADRGQWIVLVGGKRRRQDHPPARAGTCAGASRRGLPAPRRATAPAAQRRRGPDCVLLRRRRVPHHRAPGGSHRGDRGRRCTRRRSPVGGGLRRSSRQRVGRERSGDRAWSCRRGTHPLRAARRVVSGHAVAARPRRRRTARGAPKRAACRGLDGPAQSRVARSGAGASRDSRHHGGDGRRRRHSVCRAPRVWTRPV